MNVARSLQQHVSLPLCLLLCLCERASRRASGLHCVCTGHPWCMIASCIAGTADASPQALSDLQPQFRFLLLLLAGRRSPSQECKGKYNAQLFQRLCLFKPVPDIGVAYWGSVSRALC